jgi:hypothetical protein
MPFAAHLNGFFVIFHSLKVPKTHSSALFSFGKFWACVACRRTDKLSNYRSNKNQYLDINLRIELFDAFDSFDKSHSKG